MPHASMAAGAISETSAASAIATLTLAFASDPRTRWRWPRPDVYLSSLPRLARAVAGAAFARGGAYAVGDLQAVALWLPPGVEADGGSIRALFEDTLQDEQLAQSAAMLTRLQEHHPREPHWYLPLVGVDPAAQGRGLGAAVMAPVLARCDRDGSSAYLESSNPRNLPFYERLGFRALAKLQVGDGPALIPMLRSPRPPAKR
jgi:GNAT superfamily N-acetyltransferase